MEMLVVKEMLPRQGPVLSHIECVSSQDHFIANFTFPFFYSIRRIAVITLLQLIEHL